MAIFIVFLETEPSDREGAAAPQNLTANGKPNYHLARHPKEGPNAGLHPVRTRSVASDVVGQIVDRVRSGELKVGDVLPGERVLAAQMDVSRPTVGAAMAGWPRPASQSRPGRQGNAEIISIWIPEGLHDSAGGSRRIGGRRIFRVLEARKTLEPRIAQLAAFRATDEDYASCRVPSIFLLPTAMTSVGVSKPSCCFTGSCGGPLATAHSSR